jgi:hypothetical protein
MVQSDATLTKFFSSVTSDTNFRLPNLRKLKLQRNPLTIVSVNSFLSLMPHLTSLDISFTNIRHRPLCASPPPIEKLVLTSTAISITDLMAVVASLPGLKTLAIGAMGGTTPSLGSSKFLELTEVLETLQHLEDISLVNNSHLGYAPKRRAIATFIQKVGRRCKVGGNFESPITLLTFFFAAETQPIGDSWSMFIRPVHSSLRRPLRPRA